MLCPGASAFRYLITPSHVWKCCTKVCYHKFRTANVHQHLGTCLDNGCHLSLLSASKALLGLPLVLPLTLETLVLLKPLALPLVLQTITQAQSAFLTDLDAIPGHECSQ